MPNWCENQLIVNGSKAELLVFQTKVKGTLAHYALSEAEKQAFQALGDSTKDEEVYNFTFHSLVPVPQEVLDAGYNKVGYNWQSDNWGTKWDIHGADLYEEDDRLVYLFSTAWAPPEPWVQKASVLFPNLTFEIAYFEPGMMYAGYSVFKEGEIVEGDHVSDDVAVLKSIMVKKLGYTPDEADEYWDFEDEEMEDESETF